MYVITGATGNTGSVVARRLLKEGKPVRVVGRSAERLRGLADQGAEPLVADVADCEAIARAFVGAQAAYVMIPPNPTSADFRSEQRRVADTMAVALEKAGVEYAVALSSFGVDKPEGTGPVVGLHDLEERLNGVPGLNVLHLRAGYFMENTLAQAGVIRTMGVTAGPLRPDLTLPMIATRDIGEAAAHELLSLSFQGSSTRELLGQRDITMAEVTRVIGKAIGKPDLPYVQMPDEQFVGALTQMGMSSNVAGLILELSQALNSGHVRALEARTAQNSTATSYEQFVEEEFVPAYQRSIS